MTYMGSFDQNDNGGSFDFNGSSNFGEIVITSTNLTSLTYVAVIKSRGLTGYRTIIDFGNDNLLFCTLNNILYFYSPSFTSSYTITADVWYFVAVSISITGTIKFYVNGNYVAGDTGASFNRSYTSWGIGAGLPGPSEPWSGKISKIAAYNYELTSQQILQLYNENSGNSVTIVGAGSTIITATQAASGNYSSGSITTTLTVNPATITGTNNNVSLVYNGNSQTATVISNVLPAGATYTGSLTATGTNVATYSTTITGHTNYTGSVSGTLTIIAATITGTNNNVSVPYNGSSQTVTVISNVSPAGATYTGSLTATGTNVGTYSTTITGHTNYTGSVSGTLTIYAIAPTFNTFSAISKNFGDSPFTISASSNSSGAITYTSSNPSVATISGTTVTIVAAGSTLITANQAASGNYTSGSTSTTLTVIPLHLYTFTGHTFTNAGAIGRNGPTLSTVRTAYSGVSWAQDTTNNYLNMTTQGIQLWTVPQTGSYTFRAIGAGSEYANVNGGQGVDISTTVNLTKGEVIRILVGQKGSANNSGGGGGATYAVKNDGTTIIVAGGGGGAFNGSTFINSIPQSNATTNNSGNNSFFNQ
jgi:hypothetical protein